MSRMLLIHCPTFSFETFSLEVCRNRGYYAYPPAGLQCLKAAVEAETEVKVTILDLNFAILDRLQNEDGEPTAVLGQLLDEALKEKYAVIGVSAGVIVSNVFGVKAHPFIQTLARVKGRAIIVAGGVIATNERANLLVKGLADFVFDGEGEEKLIAFLNGTPATEGPVNFRWDLVPTYRDVPVERYEQVGSLSPFSRMVGTPFATIQLNRGCRAHCSFCGVTPFMGRGVRSYREDAVIAEIEYLKARGIRHLEWLDDDMLRYSDRITSVLESMEGMTWAANNGLIASSITEDLLETMVASGCVGFRIGVESGNDEILKRIKKPASRKNLIAASRLIAKHPKLFAVGCYIIGHPGETYRQMLDTIDLCLELNLAWSGFSVYQVVREGSITQEFYQEVSNFVPPKDHDCEPNENVFEVLRTDGVHERRHLDEIWFYFNLTANYLANKNLLSGGDPRQFVRWVSALQLSYPRHPLMSLFMALAYILLGDRVHADQQYVQALHGLRESESWRRRFREYGLNWIVHAYPMDESGVYETLAEIRDVHRKTLELCGSF